jgi:hypothetical protein
MVVKSTIFNHAKEVAMRLPVANMNVGTLAAGAGVVLLTPVVLPLVGGILRPVVKTAIKGSLLVYDTAKGAIVKTKESIEDMTAEAKAELQKLTAEAKAEVRGTKTAKKKPANAKA